MTDDDRASLLSLSYFGFILGAMISGFFSDTFGRKPLVIIHSILFIPFTLWSALANDLVTVYLTRFVVGLSVGIMLPVAVSLMAELALPSQRGWMILTVPSLGFVAGQVMVLLVGLAAMRSDVECTDDCGWWRWVFAAGAVPNLLALGMFLAFVPESPRYLLLTGRVEEAEAVVRTVAVANGTEGQLLQGGRLRPLGAAARTVSPWDLFNPPLVGELAVISTVWMLFGFGLYGLNFMMPVLLETEYHLNSFWQVDTSALQSMFV